MRFARSFRVAAPLEEVSAFHASARSLKAITPPLTPMKVLSAPDPLIPPCEMEMRLWMGPFPIRWKARLESLPTQQEGAAEVERTAGFIDRQLEGPFDLWRHEHRFVAEGASATWVYDSIEARLKGHPLWFLAGLLMWVGLHPLFLYRADRTRKFLEPRAKTAS